MKRLLFFMALLFSSFGRQGYAETPRVVTSIMPLHALISGVMKGVGEPTLLLKAQQSPHTFALTPRDMKRLHQADLIFWVGPLLEGFLKKPLKGVKAQSVPLLETPGLKLFPLRFDHDHLGHNHDHGHSHNHNHSHHHGHNHGSDSGGIDAHIWLSPFNAEKILRHVARVLSNKDPQNKDLYQKNAERMIFKLETLTQEITQDLQGAQGKPFLVFHDGYQYFERTFGLENAGAVTLHPEIQPSVRKLDHILNKIEKNHVVCLFAEVQFPFSLIDFLRQKTSIRVGILDPFGLELEPGEDAYFDLMRNLTKSFKECLMPLTPRK